MFGISLTSSKYERPAAFKIQLEKQIYIPGEVLRGTLRLSLNKPTKCRGVRVHLQGKGHSHMVVGNGDNKRHIYHTQFYTNCRRTVYGNVHKTPVLDEVGENALFGPPWAPDEGVLLVNMPMGGSLLILQAMDYAWEKRDALLGETIVDINQCVGRGQMQCQLMRNGKPETGSIFFQMDWDDSNNTLSSQDAFYGQTSRCLRVQIFRAVGLRSAEWFGKNDVYVRVYPQLDASVVVNGQALPSPTVDITLPQGEMVIPFAFQLPADLPSSIVRDKENYIAYSIYANIDVAWKPHPAAKMLWPLAQDVHMPMYTQFCIPPFCCCSLSLDCVDPLGTLHFGAGTDRAAYAPGETIRIWINLTSDREDLVSASTVEALAVTLTQHVHLWADGYKVNQSFNCATMPVPVGTGAIQTGMRVPSISPTYRGGLGQDQRWFGEVARFGGRWKQRPDPITWDYSLFVSVRVKLPGITLEPKSFTLHMPITISGLGLAVMNVADPPLLFGIVNGRVMAGAQAQQTEQAQQFVAQAQAQPPALAVPMPQAQVVLAQPVSAEPPMSRPSASATVVPLNTQGFEHAQPQPQAQAQPQPPPQAQAYAQPQSQAYAQPQSQPAMGGYATTANTNTGATNTYGFTQDVQWKDDDRVKQALPALRNCQLAASSYETQTIRDEKEDMNPQDVGQLAYKPMFFMSPPSRH